MAHCATQLIHRLASDAFVNAGVPVREFYLIDDGANGAIPDLPVISNARVVRRKGIWRYLPSPLVGQVSALLSGSQTNVVLCDGLGVMRPLLPLMKRHPALKLIVVVHGLVKFRPDDMKRLEALTDRIRLIAVSTPLAAQLSDRYPALNPMVRVVPNALCPDFQARLFDRHEARQTLNLPQDKCLVAVCSRLIDKKNTDLVVRAFAQANRQNNLLVIMGDGPEKAALMALAEALGISDRVIWLGWVKDANRYLKGFDVFVSASEAEGFGLSVLEANAAGLPVICSRIPAHEDVLGEQGYFFDVGDVNTCAKWLEGGLTPLGDGGGMARYKQFVSGYLEVYSELIA